MASYEKFLSNEVENNEEFYLKKTNLNNLANNLY